MHAQQPYYNIMAWICENHRAALHFVGFWSRSVEPAWLAGGRPFVSIKKPFQGKLICIF